MQPPNARGTILQKANFPGNVANIAYEFPFPLYATFNTASCDVTNGSLWEQQWQVSNKQAVLMCIYNFLIVISS